MSRNHTEIYRSTRFDPLSETWTGEPPNPVPEEEHVRRSFKPKAIDNEEHQVKPVPSYIKKTNKTPAKKAPQQLTNEQPTDEESSYSSLSDLSDDQQLNFHRVPRKRTVQHFRSSKNFNCHRKYLKKNFDRRNGIEKVRAVRKGGAGSYNWGQDETGSVNDPYIEAHEEFSKPRKYSSTTAGDQSHDESRDTTESQSNSSENKDSHDDRQSDSLINKGLKRIQNFLGF